MKIKLHAITLIGFLNLTVVAHVLAGSVAGEVKFAGLLPRLPAVTISKDQDYCGESLSNETYIVSPAGALKNVVVFIDLATTTRADPHKLNTLENDGCRYSPRIMAMQRGERLRVTNKDPKLHIPHSYLNDKTVFMMSLPFRNVSLEATQKIRETGIMKIVCDTHAWMLGYLHVFDHSYFAVTDENGMFVIPSLPPGNYILKAWHEDAGMRSQEITVPEQGELRVGFEFGK